MEGRVARSAHLRHVHQVRMLKGAGEVDAVGLDSWPAGLIRPEDVALVDALHAQRGQHVGVRARYHAGEQGGHQRTGDRRAAWMG